MIYFMQPVDGGPVKIGFTDDLETRRQSLENHYGTQLAVLGTVPGDRDMEKKIHEKFSHLRFGRTEQFAPAAELMEFIGRPLLVDPNPNAVEAMELNPDRRTSTVVIKCRPEWKEWLLRFAQFSRVDPASMIDLSLADRAKAADFPIPPSR